MDAAHKSTRIDDDFYFFPPGPSKTVETGMAEDTMGLSTNQKQRSLCLSRARKRRLPDRALMHKSDFLHRLHRHSRDPEPLWHCNSKCIPPLDRSCQPYSR